MGIDFSELERPLELPAGREFGPAFKEMSAARLARFASDGNKYARLELGRRFESGCGVPQNIEKAIELYRSAGGEDRQDRWLYSPGVGQAGGSLIRINEADAEPAVLEASLRLSSLTNAQSGPPVELPPIECRQRI